jgi:hypothetical protein
VGSGELIIFECKRQQCEIHRIYNADSSPPFTDATIQSVSENNHILIQAKSSLETIECDVDMLTFERICKRT